MADFEMRDLFVKIPKSTADFRSLAPNAPMPWSYLDGSVRDARCTQVCATTPLLAIVIVLAVNTCAGHWMPGESLTEEKSHGPRS